MTPTTKTELLLTIRKGINKEFIELDVGGRPFRIYTARSDAAVGEPCHVKEYIYYPGTNIIKGRKEGYATWLSAYDVDDPAYLVDDFGDSLQDNFFNDLLEI